MRLASIIVTEAFEHSRDSSQWGAFMKAVMKRRVLKNERYCSVFHSETLTRPHFIVKASVRHLGEGTPSSNLSVSETRDSPIRDCEQ
jgi:hypothetical protein